MGATRAAEGHKPSTCSARLQVAACFVSPAAANEAYLETTMPT